jgi:hypothetical protein
LTPDRPGHIVLPVSSVLNALLVATGTATILLGVWHLSVPRVFRFARAVEVDEPHASTGLGSIRVGLWRYERRRADVVGLSWVMSNAASFVLVSIGILDIAWAVDDRTIPIVLGSAWIAAWWGLRAAGQFALGRRPIDLAIALGFAVPGAIHVVTALVP